MPALVGIIKGQYAGNISDYDILDQGWDSIDAIEMIIDFEEKFLTEIDDKLLDTIVLDRCTPVDVCQDFVGKLTDQQVSAFLMQLSCLEQAAALEKEILVTDAKIDEQRDLILQLRETLKLGLEKPPVDPLAAPVVP